MAACPLSSSSITVFGDVAGAGPAVVELGAALVEPSGDTVGTLRHQVPVLLDQPGVGEQGAQFGPFGPVHQLAVGAAQQVAYRLHGHRTPVETSTGPAAYQLWPGFTVH